MDNSNLTIIKIAPDEEANQIALEIAINQSNTLIMTSYHEFIPPFSLLIRLKNKVFLVETDEYLRIFKKYFHRFETFIFVNYNFNNFEIEFYRQASSKFIEKNIYILKIAN